MATAKGARGPRLRVSARKLAATPAAMAIRPLAKVALEKVS